MNSLPRAQGPLRSKYRRRVHADTLARRGCGSVEGAPTVAEVSFKCDMPGGEMSGKAARRALKLFNALQEDLGDYLTRTHASKTALALPAV